MTSPASSGFTPLTDRSILVTGGTGSFGYAFVRRALADGAKRIVVFSRDELKQSQMRAAFPDARMRFFLGDVRDAERVRWAMAGVDTVVHAAAMKRIEACEADPLEAIDTNILGTRHVALAAIDEGVTRAVFLSTDKAPAAHTLYGGTKFCAERLWVQSNVFAAGTGTMLSATRYGNVLGSRGSVVELWRRQIAEGAPITITDARMTRFWMSIHQAVDLVCTALDEMRGGEVFVPKVPSASVLHLAAAITGDARAVETVETGLRPGERLHETLIAVDETARTFDCGTHYIIEPESPSWDPTRTPPRGYQDFGDAWRQCEMPRVESWFSYRSDSNPQQATVAELRELVA